MISIITGIYNQLAMNRLFLQSLRETTVGEWELIVVDNGSTDGSAEFFESAGENVRVIQNDGNYSYPYCQNVGIEAAKGDILAFFNNDIFLSDKWDTRMCGILGKDGYEALTLVSNDNMISQKEARRINRWYKKLKYPLFFMFGRKEWVLKLMVRLTYGNWRRFCEKNWDKYGLKTCPGFAGSAVLITKRGLELLGRWDPTQQGGDFDLFFRSVERWKRYGDVKPLSLVGGVYHHHFSRLTLRAGYPEYRDAANLRSLDMKWDADKIDEYMNLIKKVSD